VRTSPGKIGQKKDLWGNPLNDSPFETGKLRGLREEVITQVPIIKKKKKKSRGEVFRGKGEQRKLLAGLAEKK